MARRALVLVRLREPQISRIDVGVGRELRTVRAQLEATIEGSESVRHATELPVRFGLKTMVGWVRRRQSDRDVPERDRAQMIMRIRSSFCALLVRPGSVRRRRLSALVSFGKIVEDLFEELDALIEAIIIGQDAGLLLQQGEIARSQTQRAIELFVGFRVLAAVDESSDPKRRGHKDLPRRSCLGRLPRPS